MDELRLDLVPAKFGSRSTFNVRVLVNGRPLSELARVVELPHAEAEGNPNLAGDYAPLIVEEFRVRAGFSVIRRRPGSRTATLCSWAAPVEIGDAGH